LENCDDCAWQKVMAKAKKIGASRNLMQVKVGGIKSCGVGCRYNPKRQMPISGSKTGKRPKSCQSKSLIPKFKEKVQYTSNLRPFAKLLWTKISSGNTNSHFKRYFAPLTSTGTKQNTGAAR